MSTLPLAVQSVQQAAKEDLRAEEKYKFCPARSTFCPVFSAFSARYISMTQGRCRST